MRRSVTFLAVLALLALPAATATALGTFVDDDGTPHEGNIEAISRAGLTDGCNEAGDRYCPSGVVTRGQMARFLVSATGVPSSSVDAFGDDDGTIFEADINAAAAAGITGGCDTDSYCPGSPVTRGQMAAFLTEAYDLAPASESFSDVPSSSPFASSIGAVAAAGITVGCDDGRFCPTEVVTRGQFASFLARAEGLDPIDLETEALGETAFFEDFSDGDWEEHLATDLYHRDDILVGMTSWPGSHQPTGPDDACSSPDEKRTITRGERGQDFNDDWVYRCAPGGDPSLAHLMTAVGDTSGYSIGSITPREVFTDVVSVQWEQNVNPEVLSARQFTEVAILPAESFDSQNLPCGRDLPCSTDDLDVQGGIIATLNNGRVGITTGNAAATYTNGGTALCATGSAEGPCNGERMRVPLVFRDNRNGTVTFSARMTDGVRSITVPGSFPSGRVRVVWKDHTYTPSKVDAESYTWHWDNLRVGTR